MSPNSPQATSITESDDDDDDDVDVNDGGVDDDDVNDDNENDIASSTLKRHQPKSAGLWYGGQMRLMVLR